MDALDRLIRFFRRAPSPERPASLPQPEALPPVLADDKLLVMVAVAWDEQRQFEAQHPVAYSEAQRRLAVEQRVNVYCVQNGLPLPPPANLAAAVRLYPRGW